MLIQNTKPKLPFYNKGGGGKPKLLQGNKNNFSKAYLFKFMEPEFWFYQGKSPLVTLTYILDDWFESQLFYY